MIIIFFCKLKKRKETITKETSRLILLTLSRVETACLHAFVTSNSNKDQITKIMSAEIPYDKRQTYPIIQTKFQF